MLIEEFEKLLKRNIALSDNEKIHISEYTIAKVIQCLKAFTSNNNLTKDEIKNFISIIVNNEKVRTSFQYAKYIEPEYEWLRESYKFCDVNLIYEKIFSEFDGCLNDIDKEQVKNPGIINRTLIFVLDEMMKIYSTRKLEMVRNSLVDFGIKATVNKSIKYHNKRNQG